MELKDIIPSYAQLELVKLKGKKLTVRPISLEDDIWIGENFTNEEMKKIYEYENPKGLMKLMYHLLDYDSKVIVMKNTSFTDLDENGKEVEVNLTGPERLMHLVSGAGEYIKVLDAYLKTRAISQPVIDHWSKQFEEEASKKKELPTGESTSI